MKNLLKNLHMKKKRQALEKAKGKYGKDFLFKNKEGENESVDSQEGVSEDSDGNMINDKVISKFVKAILTLKDDNMCQELLKDNKPFFDDEDFINDEKDEKKNSKKKIYSKRCFIKL